MTEERAIWHVYTVQIKSSGSWGTPRRFASWLEAKAFKDKIQKIIDEVKENPDSDLAILEFEDVKMGEDRGY